MEETTRTYKGYDIIGTSYKKEGVGMKRNYHIKKDGDYIIHPSFLFSTLAQTKEEIDNHLYNKRSL